MTMTANEIQVKKEERELERVYREVGEQLVEIRTHLIKVNGDRQFMDGIKVPSTLSHIVNINRFNINDFCFVYFLMRGERVVCVGKSGGKWPNRILTHIKKMDFDIAWYVEVDREILNKTENKYIKEFHPLYNQKQGRKRKEIL